MARTKQTAKSYGKGVVTWTRFHLPREQEWPMWSVTHADIHAGPLADVEGVRKLWIGRMVENPEQAAYIIHWRTRDDFRKFQASPACAEFLRNLPENDNSQASIESGSALRYLTINNASSSSLSPPSPSRFLTFDHADGRPTADIEGRVTFTAFMVPRKDDSMSWTWYKTVRRAFDGFFPRGSEFISWQRHFSWQYYTVWFWVDTEDRWMEEKFGKPEQQTQEDATQGRTIICEFRLWPASWDITPEHEEASATDPQARESWSQAVAKVMPPITAWEQERWDIWVVPRFYPPEEWDPSPEDLEYEEELRKFREEYRQRSESEG